MSFLRLLSKVAFICNICFLLAILILGIKHPPEGEIVSLIIVMGYLLAVIVNTVVNAWCAFRLIFQKPLVPQIPRWLAISNLGFLIIQLILFLK